MKTVNQQYDSYIDIFKIVILSNRGGANLFNMKIKQCSSLFELYYKLYGMDIERDCWLSAFQCQSYSSKTPNKNGKRCRSKYFSILWKWVQNFSEIILSYDNKCLLTTNNFWQLSVERGGNDNDKYYTWREFWTYEVIISFCLYSLMVRDLHSNNSLYYLILLASYF